MTPAACSWPTSTATPCPNARVMEQLRKEAADKVCAKTDDILAPYL